MKGRESGMPSETYWETFFNVEATLDILTGPSIAGNVLEFGCGYGSFTLPVARRTTGYVTALDIDPEMVDCVQRKLAVDHISNVLRGLGSNGTKNQRKSLPSPFSPFFPCICINIAIT